MPVLLSDLTDRLSAAVPAVDGMPSVSQYENAVTDAVATFSTRAGNRKLQQISVVDGTAVYALADDFQNEIELTPLEEGVAKYGDTLIISGQLYPASQGLYDEVHTIAGQSITFYPTPTYTAVRYFWYKAGHVLDSGNSYPDMMQTMIPIIRAQAEANIYRMIAARVARSDGWKYEFGDVKIDKSGIGKALSGWVSDIDTEFERLVTAFIGTVGIMA